MTSINININDSLASGVIVRWAEFESQRPELAANGLDLLTKAGLAYLGTISPGGKPRITAVSVVLAGPALCVSLIPSTPKCKDLMRTPWFHLHAPPAPGGEEFSVRGAARTIDTPDEREQVAERHRCAGVILEEHDVLFELLIGTAHVARYRQVKGCLTAERDRWQPTVRT